MQQKMRRQDRLLSESQAFEVLSRCEVCRLAFCDNPAPYIVPMNFGIAEEQGTTVLYFHCATTGKKLLLLEQNPHVAFEADGAHDAIEAEQACNWGFSYESVMGEGLLSIVTEAAAKRRGLTAIMRHYSEAAEFTFAEDSVSHTAVLRLAISSISGKSRPKPM